MRNLACDLMHVRFRQGFPPIPSCSSEESDCSLCGNWANLWETQLHVGTSLGVRVCVCTHGACVCTLVGPWVCARTVHVCACTDLNLCILSLGPYMQEPYHSFKGLKLQSFMGEEVATLMRGWEGYCNHAHAYTHARTHTHTHTCTHARTHTHRP